MGASKPELIRHMQTPEFYPHPVRSLALKETHISRVMLTGDYAYKIKKPVDLGFLDFSPLQKRETFRRRVDTILEAFPADEPPASLYATWFNFTTALRTAADN